MNRTMTRTRSPIWLVAEREVRSRTRTTSFKVTTLITMLLVAAAIVVPSVIGGDDDDRRTVTIVGAAGPAALDDAAALGALVGAEVVVESATNDADAFAAVERGDADVAVLFNGTLLVEEPVDAESPSTTDQLALAVGEALRLRVALADAGLGPREAESVLDAPPAPITSIEPAEDEDEGSDAARTAGVVANILLFIFIQMYGSWVILGVVEEKSSRVVEVLISALRPRELLIGKVIGIGLTALAHGGLLVGTALVAAAATDSTLLTGLGISTVGIALLWLVLGYAFYCTMFAAGGALCSRMEDAQSVSFPLMLPLFIGYFAGFSALGDGDDNPFLLVLSFLPPTAPLAMPVRYGIGAAPLWQVLVAIALTLAGTVAVARIAGRIYEGSLLRTGKRVRVKDALTRA